MQKTIFITLLLQVNLLVCIESVSLARQATPENSAQDLNPVVIGRDPYDILVKRFQTLLDGENVPLGSLLPVGVETFDCEKIDSSPTPPTSVHKLRPSDVQMVGALGDSLTAGLWAKEAHMLAQITLEEDVDISWSMGGNGSTPFDCATMPNFLRFYNSDLKGYSSGTCSMVGEASGSDNCPNGALNAAVSGETSRGLLAEAQHLVKVIRNNPDIYDEASWKVVTIFIGVNDLCTGLCTLNQPEGITRTEYGNNVRQTLDYLKSNLPKTFVNLVNALNITKLVPFQEYSANCRLFYSIMCQCLKPDDPRVNSYIEGYQDELAKIAEDASYDQDDFTVVLQPFLDDLSFPENGINFFAPDCFHFGVLGDAAMAVSLWNSMFEPVGQKSKNLAFDLVAKCPEEPDYFLKTKRNSGTR